MRLAIISDIHSNLEALTTALDAIDKQKVDQIICLGDIVGYGANPRECLQLVRERCGIILLGNHDLAAVQTEKAEDFNPLARTAAHWTNTMLSDEERSYLLSLPYTATLDDLLFVHSSPYQPEEFHYILSSDDAVNAMRYCTQRLCFVGHSHVPGMFSERGYATALDATQRYLINVGSVGQPRDGNPQLSFGLLDTTRWKYDNIRLTYDAMTASRKIIAAGLPRVLGERLLTGS